MGKAIQLEAFRLAIISCILLMANQGCFAKVRYGIDATQGNFYSAKGDYTDMLVNANGWTEYGGTGGPVPLTANGYPASSPNGYACCQFSPWGYQSGTCSFYGEGDFSINIVGTGQFTLVPGSLQKANNVTTCQFTMIDPPATFPVPTGIAGIVLGNLNPNNPPNNMHLICPGYAAYPNAPTFTKEFLAAETPFSIIRGLCDYEATLQTAQFLAETDWSTRLNPNFWGGSGQSFEAAIEYCNATNTDMWVMFPVNGTNDFSTNLATLIHNKLNPQLHVYIEYCNECWNWDYPAWAIIEAAGQANSALDDTNGVWGRHGEQVAFKLLEVRSAMQPILGSQGRFVLMGQMGGMPWTCGAGLDWINRNYGPPGNYLYGIGAAAYIVPNSTYTDLTSLFASMNDYLNSFIAPSLQQCRTLANQYNLKLVLYEGGQGLTCKPDQSDFYFLLSAQLDPNMGSLYAAEGALFESTGVDEMLWTCDIAGWSQWGYWGLITDLRQAAAGTSPKWNEAVALAKAGGQSLARTVSAPPASTHNLELQPKAHNVMPPTLQKNTLTKAQMQIWAQQLKAKNAAKQAKK